MGKIATMYIMANKQTGALYVGVTASLIEPIQVHKNRESLQGGTYRFNCAILVSAEFYVWIVGAIAREKQLKVGFCGRHCEEM